VEASPGRQSTRRAGVAFASFLATVLGGSCVSGQRAGLDRGVEGRGLAAVLSQVDAAAHDAARDTGDAAPDPQAERPCTDGTDCPTGTVLVMATYSAPCVERRIACRRPRTNDSIWLSGDFTRASCDAIVAMVARVDTQPVLSIDQDRDVAVVRTGCAPACAVNSGWLYRLRRSARAWVITERSMEIE